MFSLLKIQKPRLQVPSWGGAQTQQHHGGSCCYTECGKRCLKVVVRGWQTGSPVDPGPALEPGNKSLHLRHLCLIHTLRRELEQLFEEHLQIGHFIISHWKRAPMVTAWSRNLLQTAERDRVQQETQPK